MISDWYGRRHEDGKTFALPLKGGDPALRAETHTGAEKRPVELVNLAIIILCMFHPRNLLP